MSSKKTPKQLSIQSSDEHEDSKDGLTPQEKLRRKRRMCLLLNALLKDFSDPKGAQTALARAIGLRQAAVSGYLDPENPESRMTSKETDIKIVAYLKKVRSPEWTEEELISYIKSDIDFETFNAELKRKKAPSKRMGLQEILDSLSPQQKQNALVYLTLDIHGVNSEIVKKNCDLFAAC